LAAPAAAPPVVAATPIVAPAPTRPLPENVAVFSPMVLDDNSTDVGLAALRASTKPTETAPKKPNDRLGEILLERGVVNPIQLDEALKDTRLPIGQKLVQMQAISPELVHEALAIQAHRRNGPETPAAVEKNERKAPNGEGEEEEGSKRSRTEYLRVDVRKLDTLMDLIGELIIAETAVTHGGFAQAEVDGIHKAAVQLNRVTRGLQDVAMSLRMVPIEPTFKKMVRLVRDLSRRQGKRVNLEITGEDTEVDKSVVEAIADPLVHLIRNGIDHGLESEADRRLAGKNPEGKITLAARQQAGEIRIEVRDDGKGLNRTAILRKAIERGLIRGDGSEMSDNEVFRLIFEAGFSTADKITDISGRGVGMDVVKQNIESVKGRVEISSVFGQGTTITLRIPLTLAIMEGMLVRVGESNFTLPILSITETVTVTARDVTTLTNGQEVVRVRGRLLPVFRLHNYYRIQPDSLNIEDGLLVVVEDGQDRLCLLVDELVGQRQTVVKSLSGFLGNVGGLAGCTVLGDGSISLIIDVAKLIQDTRYAA
jgi:two-component system chemotaxis sensor kinase CheA